MASNRIIVDVEKLKNPYSGLGQFCAALGNSLIKTNLENLCFYLPNDKVIFFGSHVNYIRQKSIHKWIGVKTFENDIYHATHQTTKYFPSNSSTPVLLTVHDLNFLYKYKGHKLRSKLKDFQKKIDRANEITAISSFVKSEIEQHVNTNGKPISVIYNGNSLNESLVEHCPKWLPDQPFLFTIGIILPRKNFHVLVPVMEQLKEFNLVIAGDNSSAYAKSIREEIEKHRLAKRIFMPGKITENEKLFLYRKCSGFVFPSLAEGFGFPIIEAMSQGKPVFVNHATSLPEIAGTLGNYFLNFEASHMRDVISSGLNDFERMKPENLLKQHAAGFTWDKAASGYVEIYNRLMKNIG